MLRRHIDIKHKGEDRSYAFTHGNGWNTREARIIRADITALQCNSVSCVEEFDSLAALSKHLIDTHGLPYDPDVDPYIVPMILQKDKYPCVVCDKNCSTLRELWKHAGTHVQRNICDICAKCFQTQTGLRMHVLNKHNEEYRYYCRYCKINFPNDEAKNLHKRISMRCRPYPCRFCGERFLMWEHAQKHLVDVHDQAKKVFPCGECGQVFDRRVAKYLHFKKNHTPDLKCPHCDSTFSGIREFELHVSHHTGEKAYKCELCGKTFALKQWLKRHMIVHDDTLKKICPVCSRMFLCNNRLNAHVSKHHPDYKSGS